VSSSPVALLSASSSANYDASIAAGIHQDPPDRRWTVPSRR
jgi:hypothetical protein